MVQLNFRILLLAIFVFTSTVGVTESRVSVNLKTEKQSVHRKGKMVIANRNSGTISVIDVATNNVLNTVALPQEDGDETPEPMYVVNTNHWFRNLVWVGDRANDRVVVFDGNNFEVVATVPCGDGVFHMWANSWRGQLWVVNDVDNTVTVIDIFQLRAITTINMPEDIIADDGRPHDVVFGPFGIFTYVTFIGTSDPEHDEVVQFDSFFFQQRRRAEVGEDPHVAFNWRTWDLYVPCQGSDQIFVLNAVTLNQRKTIEAAGAHGIAVSSTGRRFYVSNLPGGGSNAIYSLSALRRRIEGVEDTPDDVAHNLALDRTNSRLYVTHSGANNTVSVFRIGFRGRLSFLTTVEVGDNPFGLAFVR